jgi:hypothetical protein
MWSVPRKMKGSDTTLVFLDEVVERPHRHAVEVDHAELGLLDRVLFLAQLGRVEHLDAERPPERSLSSSPMMLTASTVG